MFSHMFSLLWSEFFQGGPPCCLKCSSQVWYTASTRRVEEFINPSTCFWFCKTGSFHSCLVRCNKYSRSFPEELLVGFCSLSCNFSVIYSCLNRKCRTCISWIASFFGDHFVICQDILNSITVFLFSCSPPSFMSSAKLKTKFFSHLDHHE